MQVGIKLKAKLEAKGYRVMMTRNEFDRETLSLIQRELGFYRKNIIYDI